jgi:hypothetical protein
MFTLHQKRALLAWLVRMGAGALIGLGDRREGFAVSHRYNRRFQPGQLVSRPDVHGSTPRRQISASLGVNLKPLGIHQFGQDIAPGPQFFNLQPTQNFGRQIFL